MFKMLTRLILSIAVVFNSLNVSAVCLKEGDKVVLSGVLKEELFYGPPGWGEDKEHDEKFHEWILYLNKPLMCVDDVDTENADWNKKTQLILLDHSDYKTKKDLVGKEISVSGEVFFAQTGYHETPILLDNARISIENK